MSTKKIRFVITEAMQNSAVKLLEDETPEAWKVLRKDHKLTRRQARNIIHIIRDGQVWK